MTRRRSLTDRLLVRAWIEPTHDRPLRVVVRHRNDGEPVEEEQGFTDPASAGAFVRTWLLGLLRRWETGEAPHGGRDDGDDEDRGGHGR